MTAIEGLWISGDVLGDYGNGVCMYGLVIECELLGRSIFMVWDHNL